MGTVSDCAYKSMWANLQATADAVNRLERAEDAKPKRCDGCRYWQSTDRVDGECRRRAPGRAAGGADALRVFPTTEHHDWCGDHEPVPVPVPAKAAQPEWVRYRGVDCGKNPNPYEPHRVIRWLNEQRPRVVLPSGVVYTYDPGEWEPCDPPPPARDEAKAAESAWGWFVASLASLGHDWAFVAPEGMSAEVRAAYDDMRRAFLAGRASVKP